MIIPNTTTEAVADVAKNQPLSETLENTPDFYALGYKKFATNKNYAAGDKVYYKNQVWKFNQAHQAGNWNQSHVDQWSAKDDIDHAGGREFADELREDLKNGVEIPALSGDLDSWRSSSSLQSYQHTDVVDTAGGSISIRSDVQAKFEGLAPATDFAASKLVATGVNLLRKTDQTGGVAVSVGTGVYFPVPALAFGVYGTAAQNNGVLFTNENGGFLQPTVYMKKIADGVPSSVTDGVAAEVVSGANGEKFYVNPSSLAGHPCYMIVSGITLTAACAHIAWSGVGTPYNYYVSPSAASDAGTEISLTAAIAAIGNNSKLTRCGQKVDAIYRDSNTTIRWYKRNGRVQPSWTTEEDEQNEGTYIHSATISGMLSGGAAILETSGTQLTVEGTTVSYSDQNATATTEYVRYNLANEQNGTVNASTLLTVNDFGLVCLLGASGTCLLTIGYAQGIQDAVRALVLTTNPDVMHVIAEALLALKAENIGLKAQLAAKQADDDYRAPLESSVSGAPSAANVPSNWNEETMGVWQGCPRFTGQEYIDKASKKLYRCLCTPTNNVSDWTAMN